MLQKLAQDSMVRFHNACRIVLRMCPDQYAKAYAARGLYMQTMEEAKAQCLYILYNTQHWRGLEARLTKAALKELSRCPS